MSFEDEKGHIWNKFAELERIIYEKYDLLSQEIVKPANESQKEADAARRKVTEFKNKASSNLELSNKAFKKIEGLSVEVEVLTDKLRKKESESEASKLEVEQLHSSLQKYVMEAESQSDKIKMQYQDLKELPDRFPDLDYDLEKIQNFVNEADDNASKIKNQLSQVLNVRKEFSESYDEYFGYKTDSGESEEGKLAKLDSVHNNLETEFDNLKEQLKVYQKQKEQNYDDCYSSLTEKLDEFIENKKAQLNDIGNQLKSLMPDALTKGLSYAYQEKKVSEESNYKGLEVSFRRNIYLMACISAIPIMINIILLLKGSAIQQILADTPKLILSILPLYLPIAWLAFSNNKKMNLSKRLIEEYTHKEVLSKTYEGLSNQVNSLDESKSSANLRDKLLFNLIEINSENPGKLISNYDKSDHPFMEALDRSAQLTDSVERLAKIPGFRKMASRLSEKSDFLLKEQEKKVEQGIEMTYDSDEIKSTKSNEDEN